MGNKGVFNPDLEDCLKKMKTSKKAVFSFKCFAFYLTQEKLDQTCISSYLGRYMALCRSKEVCSEVNIICMLDDTQRPYNELVSFRASFAVEYLDREEFLQIKDSFISWLPPSNLEIEKQVLVKLLSPFSRSITSDFFEPSSLERDFLNILTDTDLSPKKTNVSTASWLQFWEKRRKVVRNWHGKPLDPEWERLFSLWLKVLVLPIFEAELMDLRKNLIGEILCVNFTPKKHFDFADYWLCLWKTQPQLAEAALKKLLVVHRSQNYLYQKTVLRDFYKKSRREKIPQSIATQLEELSQLYLLAPKVVFSDPRSVAARVEHSLKKVFFLRQKKSK